jgi:hypothetical protein
VIRGREEPARADRSLLVVVAVSCVLGVWMDLSPLHAHHDSDSLVPVLMSLVRWTPFYWEQNRFGSLVPLLALPVQGPFHNLLVQVALRLTAVVLSFFLLARAVVARPYWPAVGAAALALFVAGKGLWAQAFIQMQPYPQALALALGGLALLDGGRELWRKIAAGVLIILAFWVSLSLVLWIVPLLVLRALLLLRKTGGAGNQVESHPEGEFRAGRIWAEERSALPDPSARSSLQDDSERSAMTGDGRAAWLFPLLLTAVAFALSLLASRLSVWQSTALGPASVSSWPHAWAVLARGGVRFLSLPLAVGAGAVLIACLAGWRSPRGRLAAGAGLCLLATAAAEMAALGTSSWVHLNGLSIRFFFSGLLAAGMALPAMTGVLLLEGRERWHRWVNAAALLALLPVVWLRFGPPSPAAARQAFERHHKNAAEAIVAAGCTHVIGSYWRVWPAVLQADELLWQRGEDRRVWGITARSRPTLDLWQPRSWDGMRLAVIRGDGVAPIAMHVFKIPPLHLVETRPGVRVYGRTLSYSSRIAVAAPSGVERRAAASGGTSGARPSRSISRMAATTPSAPASGSTRRPAPNSGTRSPRAPRLKASTGTPAWTHSSSVRL